jgi:hypothetical protein
MFPGREMTFAAEPVFHGGLEPVEGDAETGFEDSVGDRKGVVEEGVIGEVAHRKAVDVAKGARTALTRRADALHGEAAREHDFTVQEAQSLGFPQLCPPFLLHSGRSIDTVEAAVRKIPRG